MSRWVCLRCFNANDEALVACANCGLARGATPLPPPGHDLGPSQPPEPVGGPPSGQPTMPQRRRRLLLRLGGIGVVLVAALVTYVGTAHRDTSGQIANAGDISPFDLRVGDCFGYEQPTASAAIEKVRAVPCASPHAEEVIFVGAMPDGPYPSHDAMAAFVQDRCGAAFVSYIGIAYADSALEVDTVYPDESAWKGGERTIVCSAVDPTHSELTGSVRNTRR